MLLAEFRRAAPENILGRTVPNVGASFSDDVDAKAGTHHRVKCIVGIVNDASNNPEAVIGVYTQNMKIPPTQTERVITQAANLAYQALGFTFSMPAPSLSGGTQPEIVFTAPAIGSFYDTGEKPDIKWNTQNITGRLTLSLVRTEYDGEDVDSRVISNDVIDDGEWHSLTIDDSIEPGSNYRFLLTANNISGVQAYSNFFSVRGAIRVLEPHLGEAHLRGENPKIRWTTYGTNGDLTLDVIKRLDNLDPINPNVFGFKEVERISDSAYDDGEWHSWQVGEDDVGFNAAVIRVHSNNEPEVVGHSEPFLLGGEVNITYPTAESILDIGSNPTIRWESRGDLGRLRIELWRGHDNKILTIGDDALDDGEWHSWTVPNNIKDGRGYQIRIYAMAGHSVSIPLVGDIPVKVPVLVGASDLFQIGTVFEWLSPAIVQDDYGGQLSFFNSRPDYLPYGSNPTLRWRTRGNHPGNVRLDLILPSGGVLPIAANALNDGEWHSWTVPGNLPPSTNYRIRLRSLDRPGAETYSYYFYIGQMIDITVQETSFTRPANASTTGPIPTIRWTTANLDPNTRLTLELVKKGGGTALISQTVINDGEWHSYNVPAGLAKGTYRFRLQSNNNPSVYGISPYFEVR
jgi:hypothetical protein